MTAEKTVQLSRPEARTLAVVKQGLHQRPGVADREVLLATVRRIGLLQLDTINVVARSHYLVMLSRLGLYDRADLDTLLYPDRALFEQWAHAACLIPVEHYDHLAPAIHARRRKPFQPWLVHSLGDKPDEMLNAVLHEVRERGPLSSRDFEDPRPERGTWWDWKPAKTALEVLFARGHLMVDRRENFQRYYDLAERVLPGSSDPPRYAEEDWQRWATLRGLAHLGVATARHVADYYRLNKPATRKRLQMLRREGTVLPATVDGWTEPAYLDPKDLSVLEEIRSGRHQPKVTALLSPFDNLIWHRDRVHNLFGFDYKAEMYLPAAKRQYGYYVMPILHRGRLVGRLDPKADRQARTLIVRAIYLEPGVSPTEDLVAGIAAALEEFVAFHHCQRLHLEHAADGTVQGRELVSQVEERIGPLG